MGVGEFDLADQGDPRGMVLLGFAGESGYNVGSDTGVGHPIPDGRYGLAKGVRIVSAAHGLEYVIAAALQRDVEVRGTIAGCPSA